MRDVTAPAGVIQKPSCVWRGTNVVMTGVIVNQTMSTHEFVVTPGFSLDGRPVARQGDFAVYDVGPFSARAWKRTVVGVANQAGSAITACNPSVSLPSSSD